MNTKQMIEIERKRELPEPYDLFVSRLKAQGFSESNQAAETDTYYSRPDVDFMQTVECLRIRERGNFAEITYKPASSSDTTTKDGVIAKVETNLRLISSDAVSTAKQLLTNLGMVRLVEVNKNRRTFTSPQYDNTVVSIDIIKGAGTYIEVEVMSENKDTAQAMIMQVEYSLDINNYSIVQVPYRDICMEKGL